METFLDATRNAILELDLDSEEVESHLGARDDLEFSERWMEAFASLNGRDNTLDASSDAVREAAYVTAYQKWKSPDLAALVSDDFGLIYGLLISDREDQFVQGLAEAYFLLRTFPTEIVPSIQKISQIIHPGE